MRVCPSCYALYGPETHQCTKDGVATVDSIDVLVGMSLGSYQVRALIGEGGMGVVYSGEHTTIGRRVALKVLRPELSLRDDIVERFVQEARSVNTISHGNIVNIYDFGKTPFGSFYLVMEYLDGKTVRSLIDEEGPQPLERVVTVITGLGAALAAAHSKGFIHRDVKPENIMLVDRAGTTSIKLLDFGIAKLITNKTQHTTHTGSALGTPQYMCPEQLEATAYDHRSDIYSLGVVAYEMLTGQVPYPGKSHAEVRQRQLTRTPPPPSVMRPELTLSRRMDAAVLWALSPDPSTRCSRMEEFVRQFKAGFEEAAVAPVPRPPRRPRTALIVAVTLMAMAVGVVIVYLAIPGKNTVTTTAAPDARPDTRRPSVGKLTRKQALALAHRRVVQAITSSRGGDRVLVVELLAEMRLPVKLVRDELLRALKTDAQPAVRRLAAQILARMKERRAIKPLRRLLAQPLTNAQTTCDYAEALALLGDRSGQARLRQELTRSRRQLLIRQTPYLLALGRLKDPAARGGLKALLDQSVLGSTLMYQLLGHLARMGDKTAENRLLQVVTTDAWPARVKAAIVLLEIQPEKAKSTLRAALGQTTGGVRLDAARHLAFFQDAISAKDLLESIESQDTGDRKESALALGHLPGLAGHEALIGALDDRSEIVSLAAAVGLLPWATTDN